MCVYSFVGGHQLFIRFRVQTLILSTTKQFKDSKHEGGTHSDRYTSISVAVIISHWTKEEENTNSYVYIHVHGSVYTQGTTESLGAQRLTVLGC